MRRATARAAMVFFGSALAVACVSNSNSTPPAADGSPDLDGGGTDTGTPSDDSGAALDAGGDAADATVADATIQDGASTDGGSDASDASDASVADAADAAVLDASPGTVTSSGTLALTIFRQGHSATLLNDGRVLFCGGYYTESSSLTSCDVFDPTTTTMGAGAAMHYGRQYASATVLANGQLLMAGGTGPTLTDGGGYGVLQNAEIFDPTANAFTLVTAPMQQARTGQPAVLLSAAPNTNQVLLVGGTGLVDGGPFSGVTYGPLATLEVFNPGDASTEGTFALASPQMHFARTSSAAVLLPEAGVLIVGGNNPADGGDLGELLDPALSTFTFTTNATGETREPAQSTVLKDGRIFFTGGSGDSADIFDPTTGTFSTVALPSLRRNSGLATLKSGRVLMAGGIGTSGTLGDVLIYDPTSNQFSEATGMLSVARSIPSATTLQDGRVIIAGGQSSTGIVVPTVDIFTE